MSRDFNGEDYPLKDYISNDSPGGVLETERRRHSGSYDNASFTMDNTSAEQRSPGRNTTDDIEIVDVDGDDEIPVDYNEFVHRNEHRFSKHETDEVSVFSLDLGASDKYANVWDKLHTIRLRKKSVKSKRPLSSAWRSNIDDEDDDVDDAGVEETGLLPSLQARVKPRRLSERRLDQQQSLRRDAIVDDKLKFAKKTLTNNRSALDGWLYHFELWAGTFKEIEGRFGSATMLYFRFTRWLMFLNMFCCFLMLGVVVIPYVSYYHPQTFHDSVSGTNDVFAVQADNCTFKYNRFLENTTEAEPWNEQILHYIQGTGDLERTILFYGVYHNKTTTMDTNYNMGIAYVLSSVACFVISFLLILNKSGDSVKNAVAGQESSKTFYCNKVFCAWDYCISNHKAARRKKWSLLRELGEDLKEQSERERHSERATRAKLGLWFIRLLVNLFIVVTLGASLYLIYYVTDILVVLEKQEYSQFVSLLIKYLPSLTILVLNTIVPLIFTKIVIIEEYSGTIELQITLFRIVLLRLFSMVVLIISFYVKLVRQDGDDDDDGGVDFNHLCGNHLFKTNNGTSNTGSIKCWETFIGQQFYKLALLDFVSTILFTVIWEFPRKFVNQKFGHIKIIGTLVEVPEFNLPSNVLDIVHSQTLCWLGLFFSPLLPAITLMKVIITFYVKKWSVLSLCVPPVRPYRASRSNSFFMTVLLLSFILSVVPIGFLIRDLPPSQSCGPFRLYSDASFVVYDVVTNFIKTLPGVLRDILFFLGSVGFFVPAMLCICLFMYYYWAAGQGYKKMEELLKYQLKMEGRDRQFLLRRVNEAIKQGTLQ